MNIDHSLLGTERGYYLEVNVTKEEQQYQFDKGQLSVINIRDPQKFTTYQLSGSSNSLSIKRKSSPEGKHISPVRCTICEWNSFIDPANISMMEKGLIRMTNQDINEIDMLMIDIGEQVCKACVTKISQFDLEQVVRGMLKTLEEKND